MSKADLKSFDGFRQYLVQSGDEILYAEAKQARADIIDMAKELVDDNPKYTGASSGEATGVPLPSSHPASRLSLKVGNLFNGGASGWQAGEEVTAKRHAFYLFNPMWDYYLAFVEFGIAARGHSPSGSAGFVRTVWERFLAKRSL